MANTNLIKDKYRIDIVKYRYFWLGFTGILLIPCIIAIIYLMVTQPNHSPLKLGIDFTGGTILQYSVDKKVAPEDISKIRTNIEKIGVKNPVIQATSQAGLDNAEIKNLLSIRTTFLGDKESKDKTGQITEVLTKDYTGVKLLQVNSVGPTLGAELLRNTLMALGFAFILMVVYISFRFKPEYGWIALLTLFQDVLFVVGAFVIIFMLNIKMS